MIFLTVGTQFPFDRLVKAVDKALEGNFIDEEIFAQVGETSYKPRNFESANFLDKSLFDSYVRKSSGVISHAGMGTITMALENEKPLLVMPRRQKYGEVVNDHQVAIAKRLEEMGHFLVAYQAEELPVKLKQMRTFVPSKRGMQSRAVADRITRFLRELCTVKE
jgi:UDP-N-acetylglucosamine transferase subunit ALG13